MNKSNGSQTILFAAVLPPPVHGQSVVTEAFLNILRISGSKVKLVNTSPENLNRGISYHWRRIFSNFNVALQATRLAVNRTPRTLYMVVDSNIGLLYNIFVAGLCRILRFRTFYHHHTAASCLSTHPLMAVFLIVAGPLSTQILLSQQMAVDLIRRYGFLGRTLVCHNAAFKNPTPIRQRAANDPPYTIGFMSNISIEKGIKEAIDTFSKGFNSGLFKKLILAGPILDHTSRKIISGAITNFGDAVEYRGAVNEAEKKLFFDEIDIFVFPTRYKYEAQPLVILESFSNGVPVIAYDRGYVKELVIINGWAISSHEEFSVRAIEIIIKWGGIDRHIWNINTAQKSRQLRHKAQKFLSALLDNMTLPLT